MQSPLLISVDLGTSGVKTSLIDAATGRILAAMSRSTTCYQPHPGITEQQPDEYLAAALDTIREALEQARVEPGAVAALALDGQMSGCVGIDRDGQAVTAWISSLDTRANPYLDRFMAEREADIRRITGSSQPCYGPKIAWLLAEFPELRTHAAKFVILAGYVAGRMAGLRAEDAFVDTTYAPVTGILDVVHGSWHQDLCASLGIPMDVLPRIVSSIDVIGSLSAESARRCGLLAGTPIVAGAGDQLAGFLGAGLVQPGMLIDVAGTYPLLALCADRYIPDVEGHAMEVWPSALPGLWHPMTFVIGGGLTHRWFVELTRHEDPAIVSSRVAEYIDLDIRAARLPPGSEGVLFLPHLGGRACPPDTSMRGGWLGLNWGHGEHHLYRAILEAVAYDHALGFQAMRRLYSDDVPDHVRGIGGGARSALWNQIKADVLGLVFERLEPDETAMLGAALIAGSGVGLFTDLVEPAQHWACSVEQMTPDGERHRQYQPYVQLYEQALAQVSPLYRRMAKLTAPAEPR